MENLGNKNDFNYIGFSRIINDKNCINIEFKSDSFIYI